jgi:SagB-type dehydrogenase family enzyme
MLRPKFRDELAVVQDGDAWLIDGMGDLRFIRGRMSGCLPRLIALMDGTRSLEELAHDIGQEIHSIDALVNILLEHGIVYDGGTKEPSEVLNPSTIGFYRRFMTTPFVPNVPAPWERLAATSVAIVAPPSAHFASDELADLLRTIGVTRVTVSPTPPADSFDKNAVLSDSLSLIISLAIDSENSSARMLLHNFCEEHDAMWLRSGLYTDTQSAELGPLFRGRTTPCYRCFLGDPKPESSPLHSGPLDRILITEWLALTATEVTWAIVQGPSHALSGRSRVCSLRDLQVKIRCHSRVPGCHNCLPLFRPPRLQSTAFRYEETIAAREGVAVTDGVAVRPLSTLEAENHKAQAWATVSLPQPSRASCASVAEAFENRTSKAFGSVNAEAISAILQYAAGVKECSGVPTTLRRWAPTAGNLGSAELYVVALDVIGIEAGYYGYRAQEHSLARIDWASPEMAPDEFVRAVAPAEHPPAALIVFSAALYRLAPKYQAFAYKLAHLDSGVALSQATLAAATHHIHSGWSPLLRSDLVEHQFGLRALAQIPTAVLALSPEPLGPPGASYGADVLPAAIPDAYAEPWDLVIRLYEETRASGMLPVQQFRRTVRCEQPSSFSARAGISLPPALNITANFVDVLARRRSSRRYTGAYATAQQLATILWHGHEALGESASASPAGLEFTLVALRVHDLLPGVYEYSRQAHSVYLLGPPPERSDMLGLTVQEEFADAGFQIWITMSFERSGDDGSSQSSAYRDGLVRAGVAADACAVTATALGLGGCIIAGIVPSKARDVIGLDGWAKRVLVMFAGE